MQFCIFCKLWLLMLFRAVHIVAGTVILLFMIVIVAVTLFLVKLLELVCEVIGVRKLNLVAFY